MEHPLRVFRFVPGHALNRNIIAVYAGGRMSETIKSGGESGQNSDNGGPWGEEYQQSVPPFNPEQKEHEATPESKIIDTLYDRYVNQVAAEEANIEAGYPSLSKQEFDDLKFKADAIGQAYVQHGREKHEAGFYDSLFADLAEQKRRAFQTIADAGQQFKPDGGLTVEAEKLLHEASLFDDISRDANHLGYDYDGFANHVGVWGIRSAEETQGMIKQREWEEKQAHIRQKEQENIEKYGPEVYLSRIIDGDESEKVEKINHEMRAYRIQASTPGPEQPNGMRLAGAPDPDVIKEFEDNIASVRRRAEEERIMAKSMNLNGQYRDDALDDLRGMADYLRSEIDNPNSSQQAENKRKLATVNRLISKIEKAYGSSKG